MAALEGDVPTDDEGEDGDMPDDFVAMLGGVVSAEDEGEGGQGEEADDGGFDMDAHIARLIAAAELEDAQNASDEDEEDEYAAFARMQRDGVAEADDGAEQGERGIVDQKLDRVRGVGTGPRAAGGGVCAHRQRLAVATLGAAYTRHNAHARNNALTVDLPCPWLACRSLPLPQVLHEYDDDYIGELESDEEGDDDEVTAEMLQGALDEFIKDREAGKDVVKILTTEENAQSDAAAAGAGAGAGASGDGGAAAEAADGAQAVAEPRAKGPDRYTGLLPPQTRGEDYKPPEGGDDTDSESDVEIMELPLSAAVQRANAHDVETIVSTCVANLWHGCSGCAATQPAYHSVPRRVPSHRYTTTDNHPTVLDEVPATKIMLSAKTGLPVISTRKSKSRRRGGSEDTQQSGGAGAGAGPGADGDGQDGAGEGAHDDSMSVATSVRRKGETAAEKRARKAAVKEQRRVSRRCLLCAADDRGHDSDGS